MKNILFTVIFLIGSLCFISCEKEYATDIATGKLSINGKDYNLKKRPSNFYSGIKASYIELDSRKQEDIYEGSLSLFLDIDYRDPYMTEWIILSITSSQPLKNGDDIATISTWDEKDANFSDVVKYQSGEAIVSNLDLESNSAVISFRDFTVINSYSSDERVYIINGTVKIFYNCDWE